MASSSRPADPGAAVPRRARGRGPGKGRPPRAPPAAGSAGPSQAPGGSESSPWERRPPEWPARRSTLSARRRFSRSCRGDIGPPGFRAAPSSSPPIPSPTPRAPRRHAGPCRFFSALRRGRRPPVPDLGRRLVAPCSAAARSDARREAARRAGSAGVRAPRSWRSTGCAPRFRRSRAAGSGARRARADHARVVRRAGRSRRGDRLGPDGARRARETWSASSARTARASTRRRSKRGAWVSPSCARSRASQASRPRPDGASPGGRRALRRHGSHRRRRNRRHSGDGERARRPLPGAGGGGRARALGLGRNRRCSPPVPTDGTAPPAPPARSRTGRQRNGRGAQVSTSRMP